MALNSSEKATKTGQDRFKPVTPAGSRLSWSRAPVSVLQMSVVTYILECSHEIGFLGLITPHSDATAELEEPEPLVLGYLN